MNTPDIARYVRIMAWANRRYTVGGIRYAYRRCQPTKYTRIELAAAQKYLGVAS